MKNKVKIRIPARIHIDCLDIHSLIENIGKVAGGGIGIAIKMESFMTGEIINNQADIIMLENKVLVKYILDIMRKLLNVNDHYKIEFNLDKRIKKHSGFASNAMLVTGIITLINELYNRPFKQEELIKIFQENYAEEEDKKINKNIFCSGVANNTISYGGICFVDEKGKLMYSHKCSLNIKICLIKGSCEDLYFGENIDYDNEIVKYKFKDGTNYRKFSKIKLEYLNNFIIPELKKENYFPFFNGIKFFGENDDSKIISKKFKINNYTLKDFGKNFSDIDNFVMRISSNASSLCIITDDMDMVEFICKEKKINYTIYEIENNGIEIVEGKND